MSRTPNLQVPLHIQNQRGVYAITCRATGEVYVGHSMRIRQRLIGHLGALKANKHSCALLQQRFNEYGIEEIAFSILELVNGNLASREQREVENMIRLRSQGTVLLNGLRRTTKEGSRLYGLLDSLGMSYDVELREATQ